MHVQRMDIESHQRAGPQAGMHAQRAVSIRQLVADDKRMQRLTLHAARATQCNHGLVECVAL